MGPTTSDIYTKAEALAHELIGTPRPVPDWVEEDEQWAEILVALDELAFRCCDCGRWWEASELVVSHEGADICVQCAEG